MNQQLNELKTRLTLCPLETKEITGISDRVQLHMHVNGEGVRIVEEDGYLHIHVNGENIGKCASAASAFMEITGMVADIDGRAIDFRLPRDKIQSLVDAWTHGRPEAVKVILDCSRVPEEAYEAVFHMIVAGVRIGEENLMRELYAEENCGEKVSSQYPHPDYYEPDGERAINC